MHDGALLSHTTFFTALSPCHFLWARFTHLHQEAVVNGDPARQSMFHC